MTTRNNIVLIFGSDIGSELRLTIPRADMTLTSAQTQTTMEAMIASATIFANGGFPETIRGAELVTTQRSGLVA